MITFVAFSLRRAWQGFWRNAVMSLAATATMVFMLVLLAGFFVVLTGLNAGLEFVEQKVEVVADIKDEASTPTIEALRQRVAAMPEVASVEYVNATEALQRLRDRLKQQGREDVTTALDTNPLHGSLEIKLKDPQVFGNIEESLRADPSVVRVLEVKNLVERVLTVTNLLRTGGLIVLLLVGVVVLFIVDQHRSAWRYRRAPGWGSRSCAWSARRTRSSAGHSSSRAPSWGCSGPRSPSSCWPSARGPWAG